MTLHDRWDEHAEAWLRWTRTPGHDEYHEHFNWPAFEPLLPEPGRLTVDLGCGEGRIGRLLHARGHRVVGIEASPTLAAAARDTGAYETVHQTLASALPLEDGSADLVVAYMTLHDMEDVDRVIAEVARVLAPGGVLAAAIVHPMESHHDAGDGEYFEERRFVEYHERDGIGMHFHSIHRPLERYLALLHAGLVLETLREPRPTDAAVAAIPRLVRARQRPPFLHLRARRQA